MKGLSSYLAELVRSQLERRKPKPIPEGIHSKDILKISIENHMCYLLLGALIRVDNLPKEEKELYSNYVFQSIQRTLVQVTELKALEKLCEEKQIKNQPMKGAYLKFIYPSPEMREMSDIDILVDCKKIEEFGFILKSRDYQFSSSERHHDIYTKSPYMVVEAHRTLYDKTVDKKQHEYFASFNKTQLKENCKYTYEFQKEDFYIYMIAHIAKHFYARGCGIRNLVDIYVYLNQFKDKMDWVYLEKELRDCGLWEFTGHMQKMAYIWLEDQTCEDFYQDLFMYMLNSGIYGKDENGIWNRFAEKGNQKKKVSAKQLKRWYYFPPLSYMVEEYPWVETHTYLLPLAWCVRGFHGVFKKTGNSKVKMLQEVKEEEIETYKEIYQKMGLHFRK